MTVVQEKVGNITMDRGFTLWFTGLSGAGKSTLARLLETELRGLGRRVEVLDGDIVRTHLSKGLGFSREDRDTNILRIGFVCDLLSRNGVIAIAAAISPYRETRDKVRAQIQDFIEIFVDCSLEECARRDVKGLYKEALDGKIAGFTGVSDPYEEPDAPEIIVMTAEQSPAESVALILDWLRNHDYLPRPAATAASNGHDPVATVATVATVASSNGHAPDQAYSEEEEAEVSKRLTDLGYL